MRGVYMILIFIFLSINIFCQNIEVIYQNNYCKIFSKKIPYLSCSSFINLNGYNLKEIDEIELKYPFTVLTGSNSILLLRENNVLVFIDEYNIVHLKSVPKSFDNENIELHSIDPKIINYNEAKKSYPSLKFKIYKKKSLVFKGTPFKEVIDREIYLDKYKYYIIRISESGDFKDYIDLISKIPLKDLNEIKSIYKNFYYRIAGIEKYDEKKLYLINFSEIKKSEDIN